MHYADYVEQRLVAERDDALEARDFDAAETADMRLRAIRQARREREVDAAVELAEVPDLPTGDRRCSVCADPTPADGRCEVEGRWLCWTHLRGHGG